LGKSETERENPYKLEEYFRFYDTDYDSALMHKNKRIDLFFNLTVYCKKTTTLIKGYITKKIAFLFISKAICYCEKNIHE